MKIVLKFSDRCLIAGNHNTKSWKWSEINCRENILGVEFLVLIYQISRVNLLKEQDCLLRYPRSLMQWALYLEFIFLYLSFNPF